MPNFLLAPVRHHEDTKDIAGKRRGPLLSLKSDETSNSLHAEEMHRWLVRLLFRMTGACVIFSARDTQRRCTQTERGNCRTNCRLVFVLLIT